jgi:AcrR family transcriptional regulator
MMIVIVKRSDSRERMVVSAVQLLREQGYTGTGFRDVIAHSGAPRGSIYHHFPGGKAELAEEAVRTAADYVGAAIEAAKREDDPVAMLRAFLDAFRPVLEPNGFRAGCPVVAVAAEAHDDAPQLADAAAAAFAGWEEAMAAALRRAGLGRARARRLATLVVSAVEGAIVICRAERDGRALDDVARELEAAIRDALRPLRAPSGSRQLPPRRDRAS